MRKLIIAVLLLIAANTFAQGNSSTKNTISVSSSVKFKKEVKAYKVKLIMGLDQMGYGNTECNTLDELKEKYFDKLKEKGIDPNKLKEQKIEYLSMYYQREGTVYYYEATTEEEVQKVLSARVNGVTNNGLEYRMELDDALYDNLIEKALEQAEDKANRIAKKANRKVGKIAMISDNSYTYEDWVYYSPKDEYLRINVVFELL
ncbi:SIMPL domain-containing protein [Aureibaculum sp. 2210JD6-5]|uniref:SIMPL domain-containing protein n=1 Tax=Aureibaculum sp. 2210JD6-5 TaxID=3103957 RepID=UPI002AAC79A8|nr:SIMPL domain-containing protein [Aureibaculum sp. 2210JD6-5]MDY7394291.1 SIMPL domain-containing protein [Aureibaculum sp. 2210JD6-5]